MTTASSSIHERMVAIIGELPAIDKSQRNEQQGFMFRGHDDVLNALNPLLAKHGVLCVPDVLDRQVAQRTTSRGSVMFEVNLHVKFTFYGAGGDSLSGSTWGEGTDMGDKATSKAMTMAFKSMLNQAFAISNKEADDPDRNTIEETAAFTAVGATPAANAEQPARPAANGGASGSGTISEAQAKRLFAISKSKGVDQDTVKRLTREIAGVESSAQVPRSKYDELVEAVEAAGAACGSCGTTNGEHSAACPESVPF